MIKISCSRHEWAASRLKETNMVIDFNTPCAQSGGSSFIITYIISYVMNCNVFISADTWKAACPLHTMINWVLMLFKPLAEGNLEDDFVKLQQQQHNYNTSTRVCQTYSGKWRRQSQLHIKFSLRLSARELSAHLFEPTPGSLTKTIQLVSWSNTMWLLLSLSASCS